ncbi:MAG: rhodanese [Betaproteobacteria bacterium HGW-Betaproteobacteria-11]|nr:MAG: rhodanese [Betaproteobacteria bacterium HGW-Betaproteobacteria-11]
MNVADLEARLPRLSRLQPLAALGESRLRELLPICRLNAFPRNSNPLAASNGYGQVRYLLQGEMKLEMPDGSERVLVGGCEQGSLPLPRCVPHPLRCKAITDVELLTVDEDALDILLTWNQLATTDAVRSEGPETEPEPTDWRLMSSMFSVVNLTQGAFASLPAANIQTLLACFERIKVGRGETVIRQGDPGDYYYLIESGRCSVSRQVAGATLPLAELKSGNAFGEEALVADTARNATVTMKTAGILLRLAKADFGQLLRAPLLQSIALPEARRRVAAGAVWIDVRFAAEFRNDGFSGAINIPLNEIRQAMAGLDPEKDYVVYCQSGRRSSAAAFLLSQRGLHAVWLEGGMKACMEPMESIQ